MAWSAPRLIPRRLATIADAPWFQRGVVAAIVANAVLLGIETSPNAAPWAKSVFTALHLALSSLFVAEIAIRLGATWPTPRRFFRDPWNRFDVVVVALSLLPQAGPLALVARLARLLRLTRMFSVVPELRLLVGTMFRSIGSLGHIALLLGVILYGYALVGIALFGQVDPGHWRSLGVASLTLFEILTLEGWTDLQATVITAVPMAWLFFTSFIVLAVFVVINLFIAVVINNLEATKAADRPRRRTRPPRLRRLPMKQ